MFSRHVNRELSAYCQGELSAEESRRVAEHLLACDRCRPEFEEITVVIKGTLRVEHAGGTMDVRAGQAVVAHPNEWVRYSTPEPGGAEYLAVCLPAKPCEPHSPWHDRNSRARRIPRCASVSCPPPE